MTTPQLSHAVDIHLTTVTGTALSSSNKLEETSVVTISAAHTVVGRQNLNSDGHTKQSVTWHEYSGSMEYTVARDSTVYGDIQAGAMAGEARFLHILDNPEATTGERKGYKYEIYFESHEENFTAADDVKGSASFKVSGAPIEILAS